MINRILYTLKQNLKIIKSAKITEHDLHFMQIKKLINSYSNLKVHLGSFMKVLYLILVIEPLFLCS